MIELSFFIIGLSRESISCVFVPVWSRHSSYFRVKTVFHMKSRCCVTGWWLRLVAADCIRLLLLSGGYVWLRLAAADCIRLLLLASGYGCPLLVPNRFELTGSFLRGVF